jgi:hypothetical protein
MGKSTYFLLPQPAAATIPPAGPFTTLTSATQKEMLRWSSFLARSAAEATAAGARSIPMTEPDSPTSSASTSCAACAAADVQDLHAFGDPGLSIELPGERVEERGLPL